MGTKIEVPLPMDLKTAKCIHDLFVKKSLTLSVAESCTGGLICHVLTALPGASIFFEGGAVAYSAAAKRSFLGIPKDILEIHGAISEQTARQMAERVRALIRTAVSVSTTGNLGPGVLENKPRGLVYVAVSREQGTVAKKLMLKGNRKQVKEKAALAALSFLAEVVGND